MVRVKICGIRSLEEARWAIAAGADALGFILIPKSKRYIKPKEIQLITAQLPPFISKVGVFSGETPDHVTKIIQQCALDSIQLHGQEDAELYQKVPATKIKAYSFDPRSPQWETWENDLKTLYFEIRQGLIQGILLDSMIDGQLGGTGASLPWEDPHFQSILTEIKTTRLPVILAGGLNLQNIRNAIQLTQPFGVDVSSGVEREGRKAQELIIQFIQTVKNSETNRPKMKGVETHE